MTQMSTYFKTKTDVVQNLINKSEDLSITKILSEKNMGVRG